MKDGCAANGAKAKPELGTLIAGSDVLCGLAEDLVRTSETGECREDAARPLLAGQAMADADVTRIASDLEPELATAACRLASAHRR